MKLSVFVLTVVLSCSWIIFNDSAIINLAELELDIDNETQALNISLDDRSFDFIYPDDPILANISSDDPEFLASLNFTGNSTFDEDDKIGGNAIITILG